MALIGFSGALCFDKRLQVRQIHFPEVAVLMEPGIYGAKRPGIELIDAVPAFAVLTNQVSAAKQAQVLRNGGAGDRKCSGYLSCRLAAASQKIKDGAPGGIGEGLKSYVWRIFKRLASHNA